MADEKYLDSNGLLYLWGKIKAEDEKVKANIPTKTSDITNDSGFITSNDIPEGAAASTTVPKMNGTAVVGTEMTFARGDHVHPSDTAKVDKVDGKGLSTNDLTNALKTNYDAAYTHSQAAHAPSDAEKNVIVGVQRNGTDVTVDATTRKVNIAVPTKVSEIANDTGFITADDVEKGLSEKADKATTLSGYGITDAYTKTEIDAKITSAVHYKGTVVTSDDLPAEAEVGDMYNVQNADSTIGLKAGDNVIWDGSVWDIQSGTVDLSGCVQSANAITNAEIDTICAS